MKRVGRDRCKEKDEADCTRYLIETFVEPAKYIRYSVYAGEEDIDSEE